jgi:hypothetical protein
MMTNTRRLVPGLLPVAIAALLGVCVAGPVLQKTGPSPGKPDYSALALGGDDHRHDSFSVTMQAVSRLYGRDADYETIYALSSNGFAPAVHPAEGDKAFAMLHGRGRCIDLVGAYLGLRIRRIDFPEAPPLPKPDAQGRTWGTPAYNKWLADRNRVCARTIRQALDSGATVVMDEGWMDMYCLWGVIREAHPDGIIVGTTQHGPRDNPLDHVGVCWAITPASSSLGQEDADRQMLRRAVGRIRGDREPFLPGGEVFGLAAMDLWIRQAKKPQFQEDDPAASVWNAGRCALYSYEGANRVSSYLRRRMKTFPEAARPHLKSAAERYDRIALLLAPFALSEEGYGSIMGDAAKMSAHASDCLEPVKTELAAIASDLEKALAVIDREGGKQDG